MSDQDDRNSALADAAYQEWQQDKEIAKLQNRIKELEAQIINPVQSINNDQKEFEKDIKDPVTVKYLKAPDVDVSKFNVTNEIIQVIMSDQSEFEKWLDDEIKKWPVELYSTDECFIHGSRAARNWILSKAYETRESPLGQLDYITICQLERICK